MPSNLKYEKPGLVVHLQIQIEFFSQIYKALKPQMGKLDHKTKLTDFNLSKA